MQTRSMMIDFGSPISRANGGLQYRSPADMTTTNLKSVAASNAGKVDMSNTLKVTQPTTRYFPHPRPGRAWSLVEEDVDRACECKEGPALNVEVVTQASSVADAFKSAAGVKPPNKVCLVG